MTSLTISSIKSSAVSLRVFVCLCKSLTLSLLHLQCVLECTYIGSSTHLTCLCFVHYSHKHALNGAFLRWTVFSISCECWRTQVNILCRRSHKLLFNDCNIFAVSPRSSLFNTSYTSFWFSGSLLHSIGPYTWPWMSMCTFFLAWTCMYDLSHVYKSSVISQSSSICRSLDISVFQFSAPLLNTEAQSLIQINNGQPNTPRTSVRHVAQ